MSKIPSSGPQRDWTSLAAFLAVLITGMLLVTVGHLTAGGLTTVCTSLVALYAAWRHFRR
jgi:hypothetical protein